ncbi:MAG: polysaccharide biosynthesis/export family protein [Bacteroidota bacterium]
MRIPRVPLHSAARTTYLTKLMLFCGLIILACGCNRTEYNLLHDIEGDNEKIFIRDGYFEPRIKTGQQLCISVSSLSKEGTKYFRGSTEREGATGIECLTYDVNREGFIDMPLIGDVNVLNLTLIQCKDTIQNRLEEFLEYPMVKVSYENFAISVMGEVKSPGLYTVPNGNITILEALAQAGGLAQFGNRTNVLITREQNGTILTTRLDLTSKEAFTSPFFYLNSRDIIYVESNKGRVQNSKNATAWGSVIVGLATMAAVVTSSAIR